MTYFDDDGIGLSTQGVSEHDRQLINNPSAHLFVHFSILTHVDLLIVCRTLVPVTHTLANWRATFLTRSLGTGTLNISKSEEVPLSCKQ